MVDGRADDETVRMTHGKEALRQQSLLVEEREPLGRESIHLGVVLQRQDMIPALALSGREIMT